VEVKLHALLTSALDGGEWSVSRPGLFTTEERTIGCQLDRKLGGLQRGLDAVAKRKISLPLPGIETRLYSP
jgi:hypothetical protein